MVKQSNFTFLSSNRYPSVILSGTVTVAGRTTVNLGPSTGWKDMSAWGDSSMGLTSTEGREDLGLMYESGGRIYLRNSDWVNHTFRYKVYGN